MFGTNYFKLAPAIWTLPPSFYFDDFSFVTLLNVVAIVVAHLCLDVPCWLAQTILMFLVSTLSEVQCNFVLLKESWDGDVLFGTCDVYFPLCKWRAFKGNIQGSLSHRMLAWTSSPS